MTLRPWQKAALERLAASTTPDFLAVATPGAGKTTFALTAARQALAAEPGCGSSWWRPAPANAPG